jgi:hypothetical protein
MKGGVTGNLGSTTQRVQACEATLTEHTPGEQRTLPPKDSSNSSSCKENSSPTPTSTNSKPTSSSDSNHTNFHISSVKGSTSNSTSSSWCKSNYLSSSQCHLSCIPVLLVAMKIVWLLPILILRQETYVHEVSHL